MQNIIWVFDFDGTLVETDRKCVVDFNDIEMNITEYHEKTFRFFQSLQRMDVPISILTARHPIFIPQIEKYTNTTKIYCRDYCKTMDEIEVVLDLRSEHLKREFLEKMVQYKASILNNLSKHYEHVYFVEDYATEFKRDGLLNMNVYPILPFYMTEGHTIDGAIEYFKQNGEIQ